MITSYLVEKKDNVLMSYAYATILHVNQSFTIDWKKAHKRYAHTITHKSMRKQVKHREKNN